MSASLFSHADQSWYERLARVPAGRELMVHLTDVDTATRNSGRAECAPQQVADFRRLFCYAFSKSPQCFDLPAATPKCICVVNLSGYRAVLHSANLALIRLLCMVGPQVSPRIANGIQSVFDAAAAVEGCSLLLCLSLPWQAGLDRMHWDLRTLERSRNGAVRDGRLAFSLTSDEPRISTATNESATDDVRVLEEQERVFSSSFRVACLDTGATVGPVEKAKAEDADFAAGGQEGSEKFEKLKSLMKVLGTDRARLREEIKHLKLSHEEALAEAARAADERVGKVAEASKAAEAVLSHKMAAVEEHNKSLLTQLRDLQLLHKTQVHLKAEAELLWGTNRCLEPRRFCPALPPCTNLAPALHAPTLLYTREQFAPAWPLPPMQI
jgi:coenzyme F420-reducing hydrogenase delta subunit